MGMPGPLARPVACVQHEALLHYPSKKRWPLHGDNYASGRVESARVDIAKLGLEPLPLEGGELEDVAKHSEPYRRPDPYAALWKKLTAKPRLAYEFDGIAWGAFPGADPEDNPTCDASELRELGKHAEGSVYPRSSTADRASPTHATWQERRSPPQSGARRADVTSWREWPPCSSRTAAASCGGTSRRRLRCRAGIQDREFRQGSRDDA